MSFSTFNYSADIGITPAGTLEETARLLGQIFGIIFFKDTEWRYDEFPAFMADDSGLRYALLGIPAQGEDMRDNPTDDFDLSVRSIGYLPSSQKVDIADQLIAKIKEDGRINCWSLHE